jgi:hypothetical protein
VKPAILHSAQPVFAFGETKTRHELLVMKTISSRRLVARLWWKEKEYVQERKYAYTSIFVDTFGKIGTSQTQINFKP